MDELPDSVLNVRQFWKNTCYKIGDHVFSLDDIEHGILRGQSRVFIEELKQTMFVVTPYFMSYISPSP